MPANPFTSDVAARLYADGRPDYSQLVADIIRRITGIEVAVEFAVDVGSGTGISTLAIAPLAERVVGVEPSEAMLERAIPADNVSYRIGSAEHLPVEDQSCDLISVGSALHWFDQKQFLAEASRVAKPDAWLVVYDHWFTGRLLDHDDFGRWARDVYLSVYPSPPRDRSWRPPQDLGNWRHTGWESYDHPVSFSSDQLATYLLTQSNLQAVIESGAKTEKQLRSWLMDELAPFFTDDPVAVFMFGGFVAGHRRTA
ncbi:MAG: class I SAM-dependent methyltransferase [Acidimicrobiia bacterium]